MPTERRPKTAKRIGSKKLTQISEEYEVGIDNPITTNQGLKLVNDVDSLKAGVRGPSLLEDFHLREKITHFDHERIPERVVHARGSAAHGVFQVYKPMTQYTSAAFLQDPDLKTPVFVRFSTVAGSRGSSDLARDVRGFAVKFYTDEGNFDLVGNNIPVFFIQDGVKFPDLIHAVKPEPHHEMPQAASAHDTFWDFISLMPESAHMIMWAMSDRAIPRSLRMMEGFGVHTFRFVNDKGKSRFVKFHWKPLLGLHSVVWDEAQKISGKDPDFHRRDLWESIENGDFPEWEFGVQIVEEEDEHKFYFDLLDPTKIIPEELVPVKRIGKLTLNRNPENFFAETEQVAFHPGHVVPGIDFTNDPLLQARLFSYTDTQLLRLGGPNFHEIPINQPTAAIHNHQRDGFGRKMINRGQVSYNPNSIGGGCPFHAGRSEGGYASFTAPMDSPKVRGRGEKFFDHFTQAALFFRSQTEPEQNHIIKALRFELGKVERPAIRERMLFVLDQIDKTLAAKVADGLGLAVPKKSDGPLNRNFPADANPKDYQPTAAKKVEASPALSMAKSPKDTIKTRKIAVLAASGVDEGSLNEVKKAILSAGGRTEIVADHLGEISTSKGSSVLVKHSVFTTSSVLFDAVYVPGGKTSVETLRTYPEAIEFVKDAYQHCKAIGAFGEGAEFISEAIADSIERSHAPEPEQGIIFENRGPVAKFAQTFIKAIAEHRHWGREPKP